MVLVQKWPFFQLFFLGNTGQENVFYDNRERKYAFLGYENNKFKKFKNWHFCIGVNPWFWSKKSHFSNFFFLGNLGQENVFYDIIEQKDAFLGYKNNKFKNFKNWHFFKGVNPWFWSKNGHFWNSFFLVNIGKGNVFYDILERKTPFQAIKTRSSKSPKIDICLKGLTHCFGPKIASFSTSFLGNKGQENVFCHILERKNVFLGYKKKKFKKSKNWHFCKGVNPWFWSKNGHFSNFFF